MADGMSLAHLLATAGQAVSPQGSWQESLGGAVADESEAEQNRRFISGLLSGASDISGMAGLDPNVVLKAIQLKNDAMMNQARSDYYKAKTQPEPTVAVSTPWGVENIPRSEVADFKAKLYNMQQGRGGTSTEQYRIWKSMPKEERPRYREWLKETRGKTVEEILGLMEAKQRRRHQVEQELTLGSAEHYDDISKSITDAAVSQYRTQLLNSGYKDVTRDQAREYLRLDRMAKDLADAYKGTYRAVRWTQGDQGVGFYGFKEDDTKELIKPFKPRVSFGR